MASGRGSLSFSSSFFRPWNLCEGEYGSGLFPLVSVREGLVSVSIWWEGLVSAGFGSFQVVSAGFGSFRFLVITPIVFSTGTDPWKASESWLPPDGSRSQFKMFASGHFEKESFHHLNETRSCTEFINQDQ